MPAIAGYVIGAVITAAGSVYSSRQETKAAKYAADAQKETAMAEISATKESEMLAAETAKSKLKARQASQTNTILSRPEEDSIGVNVGGLGVQ